MYKIIPSQENVYLKIGQPRRPSRCPYCQRSKLHSHGKGRVRKIKHGILLSGEMLVLLWQSKRFKCASCLKSFSQKPPPSLVSGRERYSLVFSAQALRELQEKSFSSVGNSMKVSYGVLRKILLTKIEDNSLFKLPKNQEITLGIDEHARLKKKLATTVTLIKPQKQLLGIIAKSTSQATKEWIDNNFSLEERLRIKEICVDMTKSLKKPLQLAFPEAKFTIDKFHVVAYLNNLIKEEYSFSSKYGLREKDKRKLPQKTKAMHISRILAQDGNSWDKKKEGQVKTVFSLMPRVAELWYAKEEVRAIYKECLDKKEARDRWQFVLKLMPEVAKSTLEKHLEEILNYFDTYNTNAFTEGVHTKIKKQKRVSYGIKNPEIYVKKMELAFIPKEKLILPHTF